MTKILKFAKAWWVALIIIIIAAAYQSFGDYLILNEVEFVPPWREGLEEMSKAYRAFHTTLSFVYRHTDAILIAGWAHLFVAVTIRLWFRLQPWKWRNRFWLTWSAVLIVSTVWFVWHLHWWYPNAREQFLNVDHLRYAPEFITTAATQLVIVMWVATPLLWLLWLLWTRWLRDTLQDHFMSAPFDESRRNFLRGIR